MKLNPNNACLALLNNNTHKYFINLKYKYFLEKNNTKKLNLTY